jgi:hypothetical protein
LPAVAASVADYDRSHAGTVAAIAIPVTIPVTVTVAVPEYAPVTIAITIVIVIAVEAARLAKAVIAKPAAYALDLLDDAQLGLRRRNIGGAGEIDGVGAVGQQRRAGDGCGGGQRHQQEFAHFSSSSLFAVVTWKRDLDKPILPAGKCPDRATSVPSEGGTKSPARHSGGKRARAEGADASPGNTVLVFDRRSRRDELKGLWRQLEAETAPRRGRRSGFRPTQIAGPATCHKMPQ